MEIPDPRTSYWLQCYTSVFIGHPSCWLQCYASVFIGHPSYNPPSYNPSLTSRDFCLCVPLKKHVASKQLVIGGDVKEPVVSWLQTLDTDFFCASVHAVVSQLDKCLDVNDDYVSV